MKKFPKKILIHRFLGYSWEKSMKHFFLKLKEIGQNKRLTIR
jgi:hypothetical protein